MSVKYFKFKNDFYINGEIAFMKNDETRIYNKNGKDFVCDGCIPLFEVDSAHAKDNGIVVDRLW